MKRRAYQTSEADRRKAAARLAFKAKEELRKLKARGVETVEWREEWLASAVDLLHPIFAERGFSLPEKIRVALGWPKGRRAGACFPAELSSEGVTEIFISPLFAEPVHVLDTLVYYLCEAAVGKGRPAKACAREMDLVTSDDGFLEGEGNPSWHAWADKVLAMLGPFPHDAMVMPERLAQQPTRMLKNTCSDCGFWFRTPALQINKAALLRCPIPDCNGIMRS